MKILITLGPTHEPIDEVRYITNVSSGRMGAALAKEALRRGYETTVVAGPVDVKLPKGVKVIRVKTAKEMTEKTLKELKGFDVFVCAAAIADYSPEPRRGKMKSGGGDMTLRLRENPKLTALAKKRYPSLFVVAFKAECSSGKKLIEAAEEKLRREKLDLIVANDVRKTAGKKDAEAYVLDRSGGYVIIPKQTKDSMAKKIFAAIEKWINE